MPPTNASLLVFWAMPTSFQAMNRLEMSRRVKTTFFPSPLPWYQLGLGGSLFHQRRPPTSRPSQYFAS